MLIDALRLLFSGNADVFMNLANSLEVTGYIFVIALLVGFPLGSIIAIHEFRGKKLLQFLIHGWLFIPALSLGMFIFALENKSMISPLGFIGWGSLLAIPLITAVIVDAFDWRDRDIILNARALGATRWQLYSTVMQEKREAVYGALAIGLGRVMTEVAGFFLVTSFMFSSGFPSKPIFHLETAEANLAVAIGLILIGIILYCGIYFAQFREG